MCRRLFGAIESVSYKNHVLCDFTSMGKRFKLLHLYFFLLFFLFALFIYAIDFTRFPTI
jgi:hypothetical protein